MSSINEIPDAPKDMTHDYRNDFGIIATVIHEIPDGMLIGEAAQWVRRESINLGATEHAATLAYAIVELVERIARR